MHNKALAPIGALSARCVTPSPFGDRYGVRSGMVALGVNPDAGDSPNCLLRARPTTTSPTESRRDCFLQC